MVLACQLVGADGAVTVHYFAQHARASLDGHATSSAANAEEVESTEWPAVLAAKGAASFRPFALKGFAVRMAGTPPKPRAYLPACALPALHAAGYTVEGQERDGDDIVGGRLVKRPYLAKRARLAARRST